MPNFALLTMPNTKPTMSQESQSLILIPKRQLPVSSNVFEDFSIALVIDDVAEKMRFDAISLFGIGAAAADGIAKIKNANSFHVDIPSQFIEGLKDGSLRFDSSSQIPGNFTPNIRDKEGNLVGQATIRKGVDPTAVTSAVMNVAMMSMLAEVSHKLDIMDEKIDDIQKGQHNDRLAKVVTGFQSFYIAYKTSKDSKELRDRAYASFNIMNQGIKELHFEFDEKCKKLNKAPKTDFGSFIRGISAVKSYRNKYMALEKDLKIYYQLHTLLEVVAIYAFGEESVNNVHNEVSNMIGRLFNEQFINNMAYLCDKKSDMLLISQVRDIDSNYNNNVQYQAICIEADHNELKQLAI